MAIFTRVYGDAQGVNNVDSGKTAGNIICTGLTKAPVCFKVVPNYLSARDLRSEMGTGGAVETILRAMTTDGTVVMYHVADDANGNLSVMMEATGANASVMQTRLQALGNVGSVGNVFLGGGLHPTTVTTSQGFQLI